MWQNSQMYICHSLLDSSCLIIQRQLKLNSFKLKLINVPPFPLKKKKPTWLSFSTPHFSNYNITHSEASAKHPIPSPHPYPACHPVFGFPFSGAFNSVHLSSLHYHHLLPKIMAVASCLNYLDLPTPFPHCSQSDLFKAQILAPLSV